MVRVHFHGSLKQVSSCYSVAEAQLCEAFRVEFRGLRSRWQSGTNTSLVLRANLSGIALFSQLVSSTADQIKQITFFASFLYRNQGFTRSHVLQMKVDAQFATGQGNIGAEHHQVRTEGLAYLR